MVLVMAVSVFLDYIPYLEQPMWREDITGSMILGILLIPRTESPETIVTHKPPSSVKNSRRKPKKVLSTLL